MPLLQPMPNGVKTPPSRRRFTLSGRHYLFSAVFFLRLVILARLAQSAFLLPTRGDMYFYNDWARRILHGEFTDPSAFYGLPLYPYLLALIYTISGYNPFVPALLQALLEAGTAVLIYQIALRVFPVIQPGAGVRSTSAGRRFVATNSRELLAALPALAWGFFVPAQAYSVVLMPTAWLVFVFWFIVWRLVRNSAAPSIRECLVLGLLVGVSAMGVATILFLVPLVLAALFLKPKIDNHWPRPILAAALLFVGIAAGTSPCWIHNYFIARDPVFLSAHSGINFWIGNNPDANGYPRFPPGLRAGQAAMLQDSITAAESAAGHPLLRAEVSAYWSARAKSYIAHDFGGWLRLLLLKLRNLCSAFQYDDLSIVNILREQKIILPGIYFGLVAALSLPGMFFAWRLAPRSRWIIAAIFLHSAALLSVFITERYRLPLVPGLLILAVFGLSIFWQSFVAKRYRVLLVYLALLAGSTLLVSWPQRNPSLWALDAYNSGWQALESGDLALAEKKLLMARSYVPDNAETNFALGNLRLAQNDAAQAKLSFSKTLSLDPRHKGALNNLGVIALQERDWDQAENYFRTALEIEPRNAKTHYLLAQSIFEKGDPDNARLEIEQALMLSPDQPEFHDLKDKIDKASPR
jgi:Tfp pilus assembly protein PilF